MTSALSNSGIKSFLTHMVTVMTLNYVFITNYEVTDEATIVYVVENSVKISIFLLNGEQRFQTKIIKCVSKSTQVLLLKKEKKKYKEVKKER